MSLAHFEPVTGEPIAVSKVCGCGEQAVVNYDRDLCFRCAFIAALRSDDEARHLALGFAAGLSLSDDNITRRRR